MPLCMSRTRSFFVDAAYLARDLTCRSKAFIISFPFSSSFVADHVQIIRIPYPQQIFIVALMDVLNVILPYVFCSTITQIGRKLQWFGNGERVGSPTLNLERKNMILMLESKLRVSTDASEIKRSTLPHITNMLQRVHWRGSIAFSMSTWVRLPHLQAQRASSLSVIGWLETGRLFCLFILKYVGWVLIGSYIFYDNKRI